MRTTVTIDDELLKQAKVVAAATGRSFSELVEEALRERLARRKAQQKRERVPLPTFGGGEIRPGVDLNDSAGLLEIMERSDAAE